jgi:hypothetical protein
VKHCFLCRWSFGATESTGDEETPLAPVLKCHPNGDIAILKKAKKICVYYDPEELYDNLNHRFGKFAK